VKDEDFRKSDWSNKLCLGGCVAVAQTQDGVAVRDTKDEGKKTLYFTHGEWDAFVRGVKDGEFDPQKS
jgi:hypothetical protein